MAKLVAFSPDFAGAIVAADLKSPPETEAKASESTRNLLQFALLPSLELEVLLLLSFSASLSPSLVVVWACINGEALGLSLFRFSDCEFWILSPFSCLVLCFEHVLLVLAGRATVGSEMPQVAESWWFWDGWCSLFGALRLIVVAIGSPSPSRLLPAESGFPAAAAEELCALLFIGTKSVCEDTTHTQYTPPMRDK